MKTDEVIQMVALSAIGYLLWQKWGMSSKSPATTPTTSSVPATTPVDFGVSHSNDPSWGDSPGGISFVQQLIGSVL